MNVCILDKSDLCISVKLQVTQYMISLTLDYSQITITNELSQRTESSISANQCTSNFLYVIKYTN